MIEVVQGDARQLPLADGVVQCVVTSPPYWGLRDYGVDGQIGLERTPDEYVGHLVEVFREVRRVLRDDGTVWLNLGDSYARNGGEPGGGNRELSHMEGKQKRMGKIPDGCGGLKPKDLVGIPWMVAFALRADGWWLRSEVIWHKPNPMPESVTDRPTKSHEQVFLLSKSADYFYDAEAIREPTIPDPRDVLWGRTETTSRHDHAHDLEMGMHQTRTQADGYVRMSNPSGRNKRSVWTVATQSYSGAHFATFPEKLVEPCVLAGTSARGACPKCGAGWVRVVERVVLPPADRKNNNTVGWRPGCDCEAGEPVPCVVLDPFAGTVGRVCGRYRRSFIGNELKREYICMAQDRTSGFQIAMDGSL